MYLSKLLITLFIFCLSTASSYASDDYDKDARYLHVQKGQTLHNIVKRLYPNRTREWSKLMKDIVRKNPHAFINNEGTMMKAGARLKLPHQAVVRALPITPQIKERVGVVISSSGSIVAVGKSKISRKISKGSAVYLGDKVITGEDGFVRIKMIDQAILDLRCFSIMVIEEYAINADSRKSILNLLQGSLKKITGQIGKLREDVYELKTPLASVGVRGTEYALRVFQSKGCGGSIDADDGLYLEVIKGLVDVRNTSGKEVVAKGETAYVALPTSIPKKIKIKPGVLNLNKAENSTSNDEESSNMLWWLLGAVAMALLI